MKESIRRWHALVLLVAALPVAAETRPVPKEADLGRKRSVAPDASLAGTLDAKGKAASQKGPTLDFEIFRYRIELQVSSKRREEMADLQKLIRLGGAEREMPGWLFRLGELHWEEAQYHFFEANRRDDDIAALGPRADPARADRLRAEKKDLEARSRAEQDHAIARYREIVKAHPSYPRLDEVVFFLGENLWKQGRHKEALDAYKALITRFPKSRYVPDAWMAFGEHYFDSAEKGERSANLGKALESYKRAAAFTESTVYGFAMYKQGWVHYNLGQWTQALDLFRAVIFFGDLPTSTIAADKKLALVREARKDYVRTYSHVGLPQAAQEEFRRVGGESGWRDMLKSLAGLYFDEGKDRDAILVYHQLILADPRSIEAPLFQSRIVTSAGRMGKKDLAVQQAHVFIKMLAEAERSRPSDEKASKALADARADAENTLRTLSVQYHAEYKKTRDDPVAALAAELYRDYLEVFPDTRHAYEMRFFHAELLFALEKYQAAGEEYGRVAQADVQAQAAAGPDGKPRRAGKFFVDALENAVFAFDLVAKKSEETEKRPAADPKTRLPVPREKLQLVEACERYLKHAPSGQKWVEIAYKAANVHYRYNAFPEAVKLFTTIALQHPRHELARYAANLALDCHNLAGDWKSVNAEAKRFHGSGDLLAAHPGLKEDLERVIEQSAFKVIEDHEKAKRYAQAAEAYLAFVRDWPGSRLAATALFNASVDLVAARQLERAMEVRGQLVSRYPDDPLLPKVLFANAQDHEAIADFERAAEYYERYYAEWKKASSASPAARPPRGRKSRRAQAPPPARSGGPWEASKAQDALHDAGVLREGLGQHRKAEADRLAWVESWPDAAEAPKIFLSVADLYAREGARAKELKHLEEYQRRYARSADDWLSAQGRIARLLGQVGNPAGEQRAWAQAQEYARRHRSQVGERGMPVVAQAQLLALEPLFAAYDRITLDVKPKYLKAQLDVKGKKLLELQKAYTAVVALKQGDPAVCSLYKIGLAYQRFSHALKTAPVPKEIRGQRALVEEYRSQLAAAAEAPEKKAIEGMEYALVKSRELGVRNGCSKAATEILARHRPDQYGALLERWPDPGASSGPTRAEGHGLLSALETFSPPQAAARAAPVLPPLAAAPRPAAGPRPVAAGPAPAAGPRAPEEARSDEVARVVSEPPLPAVDKDEDLLPGGTR